LEQSEVVEVHGDTATWQQRVSGEAFHADVGVAGREGDEG
jgi:hypothetical protein